MFDALEPRALLTFGVSTNNRVARESEGGSVGPLAKKIRSLLLMEAAYLSCIGQEIRPFERGGA